MVARVKGICCQMRSLRHLGPAIGILSSCVSNTTIRIESSVTSDQSIDGSRRSNGIVPADWLEVTVSIGRIADHAIFEITESAMSSAKLLLLATEIES